MWVGGWVVVTPDAASSPTTVPSTPSGVWMMSLTQTPVSEGQGLRLGLGIGVRVSARQKRLYDIVCMISAEASG